MPYIYNPYDRKKESNFYSRTPIGITNIFLTILRERFSKELSGQETGFDYEPAPNTNEDTDYKDTSLYIEKWGLINTTAHNFAPAITVKRGAVAFQSYTFEDAAFMHPQTSGRARVGQASSGVSINCYARSDAECDILGNMVFEFLVRCRWIIQKCFEFQIMEVGFLSEVSVSEEGSLEDNRLYQANLQVKLVFDYNYQDAPIAPKLKEIVQYWNTTDVTDPHVLLTK